MDKTVGLVGEEVPAVLSIANSIAKPEMTVRLILKVPSGMSVSGSVFTQACAGQCLAVVQVATGQLRNISLKLLANQPGQFDVTGDLEWFFADQPSNVLRKTEVLSVQVSPRLQPTVTVSPTAVERSTPAPPSGNSSGCGIGLATSGFAGVPDLALLLGPVLGMIMWRRRPRRRPKHE